MALLSIVYERLLSAIHNENTTDLFATLGRRLRRMLYEKHWFDPECMLLKDALTRWVAPSVSGTVVLELRRGDDWTILDTQPVHSAYAPEKLSMEKVESAFSPEDRIGALEMQTLAVADNRDLAGAVCIWKRFTATQDEFATRGLAFLRDLFDKPVRSPRVATLTATA